MQHKAHLLKFGGTSVANGERICRAADIIARSCTNPGGAFPVVVTSAMAGVTDALLRVAQHALAGEEQAWRSELAAIRQRHDTAVELVSSPNETRQALRRDLQSANQDMEQDIKQLQRYRAAMPEPLQADEPPEEKRIALLIALVVVWGERLATMLVAAAVQEAGIVAQAVREEVIVTKDTWLPCAAGAVMCAEPLEQETRANVQQLLRPLIERGIVPVVAGFVARSKKGSITTLGRNGSDYSAALLAKALDSVELSIYTDVDGILSADPRLVEHTRLLPSLSYGEAASLAWFGSRVLHPCALIPAAQRNIPIHIRNTFRPHNSGTLVGPANLSHATVAVTVRGSLSLVVVESVTTFGAPLNAGRVFDVIAQAGAEPVAICASSGHYLSLLVEEDVADAVVTNLQRDTDAWRASHRPELAVCACIGSGITADPMNVARAIAALARAGIAVITHGASEAGILLVVDACKAESALRCLHHALLNPEIDMPSLCREVVEPAARQVAAVRIS